MHNDDDDDNNTLEKHTVKTETETEKKIIEIKLVKLCELLLTDLYIHRICNQTHNDIKNTSNRKWNLVEMMNSNGILLN